MRDDHALGHPGAHGIKGSVTEMSKSGKRVAVALARNFEDIEATSPTDALVQAGAEVTVIGSETGPVTGKKGAVIDATTTFDAVTPGDFDLLLIPGGGSPENLRIVDEAVAWTKAFTESGKPVGAICHGAQLLISAEVVSGRTLTAVNKIRDDIRNAGGKYVDEPLVIDGNLITSRIPDDLPQFNEALVAALASSVSAEPAR
jgi:protease I